jgi:hypothetical protein
MDTYNLFFAEPVFLNRTLFAAGILLSRFSMNAFLL